MMLLDIALPPRLLYRKDGNVFRIPSTAPNGYLEIEPYVAVASVSVLFIMLVVCDCYNSIWKYAGRIEFLKVIAAYLGTFIILLVGKIVLQLAVDIEVWIPIIIMYLIISAIISCGVRFCWGIGHYFLHVRRKLFASNESDPTCKRTVVIGAGYTGSLVINRCINNPNEGYYPVAVLDDDEEKQGQLVYGIRSWAV
ncbi:MAG: nucleoside-diphosphate sugar epimerase/dehydratase [Christensenellales bacterium]